MVFSKEDKFLLIRIFKSYLKNFDIYDKDQIIELFKFIFLNVKDKYNLSGMFDVYIYSNNDYGIIIEIKNLYCYSDETELKIKIQVDSLFLMEIMSCEVIDFEDVYYYKDKFYSFFNNKYDREIIYKDTNEIINCGIKIC